jgi:hypothetical protein
MSISASASTSPGHITVVTHVSVGFVCDGTWNSKQGGGSLTPLTLVLYCAIDGLFVVQIDIVRNKLDEIFAQNDHALLWILHELVWA